MTKYVLLPSRMLLQPSIDAFHRCRHTTPLSTRPCSLALATTAHPQSSALTTLVEAQCSVPADEQVLTSAGRELQIKDGVTVADLGLADGDILHVRQDAWASCPPDTMRNPNKLHAWLAARPSALESVRSSNPEFYEAAKQDTPAALRMYMMQQQMARASAAMKQQALEARLAADPMDIDAQRELESTIQQQNVDANLRLAMEHVPEAFGTVTMLYIDTRVNGVDIKAFVDSGAQSTIMSRACAERCGLLRLLDTRMAGQAVGVGTARIAGRIHLAPLQVGSTYFNCTFTVLEDDKVDFLFGLDMLKRFQGCIDLHANVLRLRKPDGTMEEVPFLPEHALPRGSFGRAPSVPEAAARQASSELPSAGSPAPLLGSGASGTAAPQPGASASGVGSSEHAEAQAHLESMGFDAAAARQALTAAQGDVNTALQFLTG